jgi:hypothetical protein
MTLLPLDLGDNPPRLAAGMGWCGCCRCSLGNVAIIGRPSPSPTSLERIWSQPPMAPRAGTRVLSAWRSRTLPPDPRGDALSDRRPAVLLGWGRVEYAIADRLVLLALRDAPAFAWSLSPTLGRAGGRSIGAASIANLPQVQLLRTAAVPHPPLAPWSLLNVEKAVEEDISACYF